MRPNEWNHSMSICTQENNQSPNNSQSNLAGDATGFLFIENDHRITEPHGQRNRTGLAFIELSLQGLHHSRTRNRQNGQAFHLSTEFGLDCCRRERLLEDSGEQVETIDPLEDNQKSAVR